MSGQWQFERLYTHGEGIYRITDQSDPQYPVGALWDALNMVYADESDNPEMMRGATRIGGTTMGGAVSGLFDYDDGTRLVACVTDGKVYQYTSGDWAVESGARATGNSTSATARWNAENFYGATTADNLLVLCNGIDAPAKYNGTDVTDLGGSPPSTGNFPTEFMGRLWMAAGDVVYASAPNNCEGWTIAGGAKQMAVARGNDGPILGLRKHGIGTNESVLLVFKANSVYRIRPTLTFSAADIAQVSSEIGLTSARTIKQAGPEGAEHLTFSSSQGLEMLSATNTSVGVSIQNITRWPKKIISLRNQAQMDVAWSLFNIDRRELLFYYPTGSNTIPKEGIIGNFARPRKQPRWTRMDRANLTCGTMFKDSGTRRVQYVGDSAGKVYQMHIATATAFDGSPFTGRIITPCHMQGQINFMKEYGYSFVDVQTEAGYNVEVYQILQRRGLTSVSNRVPLEILGSESGWGEGYWGEAVWGGISYAGERIRPPGGRRGAGLSHIISSTRWFRLNSEVIAYKIKRDSIAA